jgi:hypothetical protein
LPAQQGELRRRQSPPQVSVDRRQGLHRSFSSLSHAHGCAADLLSSQKLS